MNKNVFVALLGVLLAASIGGNAYFFSKRNEATKANKERLAVLTMKDSLQRAIQKMEDSLGQMITGLQNEKKDLTGKIEELEGPNNPQVRDLMAQLSALRSQIARTGVPSASTGKISAKEAKELEELKKLLDQKNKEINDLMDKVAQLTRERDQIASQLESERNASADMKDRVTRGAVPQFGTLMTVGIGKKGDQQIETFKFKSTEKFRISFDVLENPLIKEPVEEEISIRIIGPDGEVLTPPGNKGLMDKGTIISMKQTIVADGEMHKMKWYYPGSGTLSGKLKKGRYSTELYSRGLLKLKNTFDLN
jgi:archaellum component FlaC